MNVREDKMTYQFGPKIILGFCVPVLFRIIRRAKREYILFDVVKRYSKFKKEFPLLMSPN